MNAPLPPIATPSPPRDANWWLVAACLACASVAGGSAVFGLMVWRAPGETTPVLAAVAAFFLALTFGAFLLWRRQSYAALVRELAAERQRKASEQHKNLEHEMLRQQSEAALKLFRKLVDRTHDTLEVIDPETARILDVNEKGCADHGYTREEYLNLRVFDLDPGVGEPTFARGMEELRKSGVMVWESVHRRKDGTSFPVEVNLSFVRSERDYVVAVVRDITARKQAEAALRESEAEIQCILESTADGILAIDNNGKVIHANRRFAELWQIPQSLMEGHDDQELLDFVLDQLDEPEAFLKKVRLLYKSDQEGRDTLVFKDGRVFERYSSPLISGTSLVGRVWSFRDITERKQAEARLREQAELLDKANEAIVVADLGHRITFWNQGAARLFGWTATEMIGKPVSEVFALGGSASGAEAHPAIAAIGDWRGEICGHNRNGDPLIIETSITVICDEAGRPTGRLSISTDITERKKLAEDFLRVQRLESIGMLAAGIAHDLNNVLAPIGMTSTLLRSRVSESADLRLLDTLEKCADRGARLVRQILGFTHGAGGEPRLAQVKHLLRDITDVIAETFPKSIFLDEDIPSDLWPVMANPTQVHQVLLNLCVNARDAMPRGGTLRLRGENCVLDSEAAHAIEGAKPGAWLVLQVEDTGTGMPPDVLARMWEPFFTTKSAEKGTGLGLSTVRGIVEMHRGFITVKTEPGRGTTFRVYLPAAESAVAASALAIAPRTGRGHGEVILFVDDEPLIRNAASAILTNAGYRLVTAPNGAEAAALFEARPAEFALVITDRDMPVLDGRGLAAIIRARNPAMKILAISGLRNSSLGHDGRCGDFADAFVPKPFTPETLLNSVDQLLHGKPTQT